MARVHLTGASGSGTTTLGAALAKELGWKHLDSDTFYWLPTTPPFKQKRPLAERVELALSACRAHADLVWSGSLVNWSDALADAFDLIVFLTLPAELRLQRLERREVELFGAADPEFLAWARRYDDGDESVRSLKLHRRWLSERKCPVLHLDGDLTVTERVRRCREALAR